MALSAKPARPAPKAAEAADPIEAFIAKGGSVPQQAETPAVAAVEPAAKGAQHPLKFPADSDLFERLERARKGSVVRLPRNTWILQAIAEKLVRDGD
ncbi:hypothetical protein SAMN05216360_12553 [Methylobacterium phyllostachyos]|uniref:Uncharacterized protein n=1 Tax=Methylobacterium phyllostachyos TaxID=582672 RepID=A0A1H0K9Q9_9HYPH|nr:hypothetical protein [Methylobacterium phyllostachyos]SDO52543.1 hypothetical protein SAMN05216360_12553 [Methylobacterium phyllostachyos]